MNLVIMEKPGLTNDLLQVIGPLVTFGLLLLLGLLILQEISEQIEYGAVRFLDGLLFAVVGYLLVF